MTFLNKYYEWTKRNNMTTIAKQVKNSYNTSDYQTTLDMLSYKKDICLEIFTTNSIYYSSDSISRGCMINDNKTDDFMKYHNYLINGNKDIIKFKLSNTRYNTKLLVYGLKLDSNTYALISTSVVPFGYTFSVWRNLFIYITFIVLIVSFLLAYFVSKRISKPISKLNQASKELAKGNYDLNFSFNDSIGEINELASTLNNLKEELSKTESLRRELMANVSHDLKTPLTLIKANAEMAKDINYNKKKNREENLKVIIDEVDRLNFLVEDILDLSASQSHTMVLNKQPFSINELLEGVIKRFNVLTHQGYQFIYNFPEDYKILADKKRIEQVLYNLISNAINYSDDQEIIININSNSDKVLVEISNRASIPKQELKYIWNKYYKVDKTYHRVTYGTGLGLSIVKNLLELHKFNYGVRSGKNKTTFYFEADLFEVVEDGSKDIQKSRKKIHDRRKTI